MAIIKNPVTVIQSGGGPTPIEPLDPYEVYASTRPSDWLEMPADEDMETESIYVLLSIPESHSGDYDCSIHLGMSYFSYTVDVDFGVVSGGVFVPDSTYSISGGDPNSGLSMAIPTSMFVSVGGGKKQLVMRVLPSASGAKFYRMVFAYNDMYSFMAAAVELKVKSDNVGEIKMSNSSYSYDSPALRYITVLGNHPELQSSSQFANCRHLVAVMAGRGETLELTDGQGAFYGDWSLLALPKVRVGYRYTNMFSDCRELVTVPQITTSSHNVTECNYMFSGCKKLVSVPLFDTSHITSFSQMFSGCTNLEAIPQFDTSSGTNFAGMFAGCDNLKTVPLLDLSHATTCNAMFQNCYHIEEIPAFDLSAATDLTNMFSHCSGLKTVPSMDMSSSTHFTQMFQGCAGLETVGALDTLSGTNFYAMFQDCKNLRNVYRMDTSAGTNLSYMFSGCLLLTDIPTLDTSSATNVTNMFNGCVSLENVDEFSAMDFSSITNASNAQSIFFSATLAPWVAEYFYLPPSDKTPTSGWGTNAFTFYATTYRTENPICIIIEDDSTMVPLAVTGQQVFGNSSATNFRNLFVFVPDSMYATYTADSNWANLGNRLKKMSELPS